LLLALLRGLAWVRRLRERRGFVADSRLWSADWWQRWAEGVLRVKLEGEEGSDLTGKARATRANWKSADEPDY
jgi:hypothetical protein